ncbi:hypothetical protein GCM10010145_11670 [Streptomyces ruber]|uniref:Uncharacterized protein n=2 Tax=Streptomyces TaxID=1883 RepID=A0A918BAI2_9ACTN|nr:hypothetical protein GCM10010145_11670 [Streptomyces ruber]
MRDTASGRVGVVMGHEGPYLQLRPLSGGREWDAAPERVRPIDAAELMHARVAEANARSRADLDIGYTWTATAHQDEDTCQGP